MMTGDDNQTDAAADSDATAAGTGSGGGGDMGTPSKDLDERPPSEPQERNSVVSGGGVADESEDGHS